MIVQHAEILGTTRGCGWYAADMSTDERRREYEALVDLLGVPITLVFVPGRELPMGATTRSFEAGETLSRERFLSRTTRIRTDTEEEMARVYLAADIQRRTIDTRTGREAFFARAPKVPMDLPLEACPAVVDFIIATIKDADTSALTIVMPERSGADRHADPEWLLHDIGHLLELESPEFKSTFQPLAGMGADGVRALGSLRYAGRVARLDTEEMTGVDYGPQALVNMCVVGGGRSVSLAGAEQRRPIKRIQDAMTREIRTRLDSLRGVVQVW